MEKLNIAIIGGGAAGFFAAIHCRQFNPHCSVTIFEKTNKLLSKVKISGGGRCNVTNSETSISQLSKSYPRGERFLKKLLYEYSTHDVISFFEKRGVSLYAQDDGRIFPSTNDSSTIVDCFIEACEKEDITIKTSYQLNKIVPQVDDKIQLQFRQGDFLFDRVIICTGGSPKLSGYEATAQTGQKIISPLPSLFTFNMPDETIKELQGVSVNRVKAKVEGEKLNSDGPLLVTHWGMSGPAILKLSAYGARILAEKNYQFSVLINWTYEFTNEELKSRLIALKKEWGATQMKNLKAFNIPRRLWSYLVEKCQIQLEKPFDTLNKKELNRLIETLTNDRYQVSGKTTFKEEFVTAGGVSLDSIKSKTMESKLINNLYFAGEVIDVDGVTGGFNFQSAWTTAYIAAKSASS